MYFILHVNNFLKINLILNLISTDEDYSKKLAKQGKCFYYTSCFLNFITQESFSCSKMFLSLHVMKWGFLKCIQWWQKQSKILWVYLSLTIERPSYHCSWDNWTKAMRNHESNMMQLFRDYCLGFLLTGEEA